MPVHNAEIARRFDRLADLLEVEEANPFRVRACRNAARTISGCSSSMADLLAEGRDLSKLPGTGKDLAGRIRTMTETGRLPLLDEVQARTPAALSDLMKLKGLGPKRIKVLYRQLHITSAEDLERAARSGRIRELEGFGRKTEDMILRGIGRLGSAEQRARLHDGGEIAEWKKGIDPFPPVGPFSPDIGRHDGQVTTAARSCQQHGDEEKQQQQLTWRHAGNIVRDCLTVFPQTPVYPFAAAQECAGIEAGTGKPDRNFHMRRYLAYATTMLCLH